MVLLLEYVFSVLFPPLETQLVKLYFKKELSPTLVLLFNTAISESYLQIPVWALLNLSSNIIHANNTLNSRWRVTAATFSAGTNIAGCHRWLCISHRATSFELEA